MSVKSPLIIFIRINTCKDAYLHTVPVPVCCVPMIQQTFCYSNFSVRAQEQVMQLIAFEIHSGYHHDNNTRVVLVFRFG